MSQRHFLNPSNFGITLTLLLFPWVGIAPPYHFSENIHGWGSWILPAIIVMSGSFLNIRFTKRICVAIGWVGGFFLQAMLRNLAFGTPLTAALLPMTGVAFVLFTFYMVTDPATCPCMPPGPVALWRSRRRNLRSSGHRARGLRLLLRAHCGITGQGNHALCPKLFECNIQAEEWLRKRNGGIGARNGVGVFGTTCEANIASILPPTKFFKEDDMAATNPTLQGINSKLRSGVSIHEKLNVQWHERALQFFMVIVLAHWAEHLAQAVQIWLLHWPRPKAGGVLGLWFPWLVSSEVLHYGYALIMLVGIWALRKGFVGVARKWWTVALIIQFWHHIEHLLLIGQATFHHNLFGSPVPASILQLVCSPGRVAFVLQHCSFHPHDYRHVLPHVSCEAGRGKGALHMRMAITPGIHILTRYTS